MDIYHSATLQYIQYANHVMKRFNIVVADIKREPMLIPNSLESSG